MKINVNIPKESIDTMMQQEIKELKKEILKLENKVRNLERSKSSYETKVKEVSEMYIGFKELCNFWSDHDYDDGL